MDKTDLMLIIAGASIGTSVSFTILWQKIVCAVIGLIFIFAVDRIRKKQLDKEMDEVIGNDDQEKDSEDIVKKD